MRQLTPEAIAEIRARDDLYRGLCPELKSSAEQDRHVLLDAYEELVEAALAAANEAIPGRKYSQGEGPSAMGKLRRLLAGQRAEDSA